MTENNDVKDVILIVDDIPTNLDVLFESLHSEGFKVLVAVDGEGAIEQVKYAHPDLILLDVMMPGIDGFETCRRLKALDEAKHIPIIFMTALSDTTDKVKGFSLGAVDYITKPFQHEEVLARVNTHITIQRLQHKLKSQNLLLQQEIAERMRIEAEQVTLIADLDAFAHTVAHNLKNPMTAIVGYAEVLEIHYSSMPSEKLGYYLKNVAKSGHKAANIIEELLLLASLRKENVELTPVDMAKVVQEVQQRLAYDIDKSKLDIITPDKWPVSVGYAPWIEEIWANYLSNAIKYGGKPPKIELGATELGEENLIRFWVHDNGNGLSAKEIAEVFAPFTRLKKDQSKKGHGLGLSIVQRIIDKMGGQVGIESEGIPGNGCKFYFTLSAV